MTQGYEWVPDRSEMRSRRDPTQLNGRALSANLPSPDVIDTAPVFPPTAQNAEIPVGTRGYAATVAPNVRRYRNHSRGVDFCLLNLSLPPRHLRAAH